MTHTSMRTLLQRSALAVVVLGLLVGPASAATYTLRAGTTGTGTNTTWGYALVSYDLEDGNGPSAGDNTVALPGPTLRVPAGQNLTIVLTNELAAPTSIVIPGQALPAGSSPRIVTDLAGRDRAASFTTEVTGGGGPVSFTGTAPRPGTYLYHSGTDLGTQVHMGLYGAVVVDADPTGCTSGLAAYAGVCYDREIVVVYSEVDPDLHGAAETAKPLNYKPKYFLVNGYSGGNAPLPEDGPLQIGETVLLRFVNAGLIHYVPTLLGEDMEWIAEDGNLYPYAHTSYSALLAAGKTMDALWTPVTGGEHLIYDRRLHLRMNGVPGGGRGELQQDQQGWHCQ